MFFLYLALVLWYLVTFLVSQSSRWGRERWLLNCIRLLMPCSCQCSVSFPQGAASWSAVGDCHAVTIDMPFWNRKEV